MFHFSYTVCSWISSICAVLSPIAIAHWLCKAMQIPMMETFVAFLTPFFEPLSALVALVIKTPPLFFNGHAISTAQAVLAIIFTVCFFAFHSLSETLKSLEQRVDVGRQALQQKVRLQQIQAKEAKQKQKIIGAARRLYMQIQYEFMACPAAADLVQAAIARYTGHKIMSQMPDSLTAECDTLEHAFNCGLEISQVILSHYATLRPMDPHPPFQVGIHCVDSDWTLSTSISEAKRVASFAGANQLVFSDSIRSLLEAQGLQAHYQFQSIGVYALEGGRQEEMFRLHARK